MLSNGGSLSSANSNSSSGASFSEALIWKWFSPVGPGFGNGMY